MRAAVVGGRGYIGGELLRLLVQHPHVDVVHVTSQTLAGRPVTSVHPNLRGATDLRFATRDDTAEADVHFVALPHGESAGWIEGHGEVGLIVDLGADFRLRDADVYEATYRRPHPKPDVLDEFVAGFPELHRDQLRAARRISVPGCIANATILALHPLAAAGVIAGKPVVDARVGSSGGGTTPSLAAHHPERSGAARVYAPVGHRHQPEIEQALGLPVRLSVTAVEAVRGVQLIAHVPLRGALEERAVWDLYRQAYASEPFVRLVNQRRGVYRLPEPKILGGTNFCDVGWAHDRVDGELVVVAALDNLGKGGAGNAVQCFNLAAGFEERSGLTFMGLHPI